MCEEEEEEAAVAAEEEEVLTGHHPAAPCNSLQHTATHCNTEEEEEEREGQGKVRALDMPRLLYSPPATHRGNNTRNMLREHHSDMTSCETHRERERERGWGRRSSGVRGGGDIYTQR